ncbi:MAG: glycosyltransferase family 4 protein [Caldilineaceae bacterium]|nr:glycosyltransferase family 4 protein [Caldilineaceae bacterium]
MNQRLPSVLFVAPFGFGKKATVWARTLPLARTLSQLGHRVTLVVPPWDTPGDAGRIWNDGGVDVVQVSLRRGPRRSPRGWSARCIVASPTSCMWSSRAPTPGWLSGGSGNSNALDGALLASCWTWTTGSKPGRPSIGMVG